jgi:hypothetical protein
MYCTTKWRDPEIDRNKGQKGKGRKGKEVEPEHGWGLQVVFYER